ASQMADCQAAAVILRPEDWREFQTGHDGPPAWRAVLCIQPYLMYALLAQWFDQQRLARMATGIHPSAIIADDAQIGEGVSIGPFVVIESGVRIAAGTRIGAGCFIGPGCAIGRDGILYPHVT